MTSEGDLIHNLIDMKNLNLIAWSFKKYVTKTLVRQNRSWISVRLVVGTIPTGASRGSSSFSMLISFFELFIMKERNSGKVSCLMETW